MFRANYRGTINWATRAATFRAVYPSATQLTGTIPLQGSEGTPDWTGFRAAFFDHRYSTNERLWEGYMARFVFKQTLLSGGDLTAFETEFSDMAAALAA